MLEKGFVKGIFSKGVLNNQKGFLGPIGDDLPSLIPLLFALLVFFATFSFSFGVFNDENVSFKADLAVLNISRILKGTNYITGINDFLEKCGSINITTVKYRAGITNLFTAQDNYISQGNYLEPDNPPRSYEIGFFKSGVDVFECPNILSEGYPNFSDPDSSELDEYFESRPRITRVYPIVVEDNRVVKPMHLVVVAWI